MYQLSDPINYLLIVISFVFPILIFGSVLLIIYLWGLSEFAQKRVFFYPILLLSIYLSWITAMTVLSKWSLFQKYWTITLTMTFGSLIAGGTPAGGAVVAFPVFTKVLEIPSPDARTFGLMIQSVGMTVASVVIWSQKITILPKVITLVSFGGLFGMILGSHFVSELMSLAGPEAKPYPKVFFTFLTTIFGVVLIISKWILPVEPKDTVGSWILWKYLLFCLIGIVGGVISSQIGSGIDLVTFIVLTLTFGINEKISTPTSVVIMGINSVIGFCLRGVVYQDIGHVWDYWLVAIPVVILGAPLGAFVFSKISRNLLVTILLFLIAIELATTIWLISFDLRMTIVLLISSLVFGVAFSIMLLYRHCSQRHQIAPTNEIL